MAGTQFRSVQIINFAFLGCSRARRCETECLNHVMARQTCLSPRRKDISDLESIAQKSGSGVMTMDKPVANETWTALYGSKLHTLDNRKSTNSSKSPSFQVCRHVKRLNSRLKDVSSYRSSLAYSSNASCQRPELCLSFGSHTSHPSSCTV